MNDDLTTFIVRELGKPRDRKKIIRDVCQRSGLNWREAHQFVGLVEAQHRRAIANRPTPLLLFLSIGILLLGFGLLGFNMPTLIALVQQNLPGQVANLQNNDYHLTSLLSGAAMTIAGLIGLWKAYGILFSE